MRTRTILKALTVVVLAIGLAACGRAQQEQVSSSNNPIAVIEGQGCQPLLAGQTINAGSVCVAVNGANLELTYTTTGGWELMEAHAWIGENLADMPQTPKGNPKVGNFPYNSGSLGGVTSYTFVVPVGSLGGEPYVCNRSFLIAAHAALRKDDGNGGYQTETGWGDGDRFVDQGNWGTYFMFIYKCNPPDETPGQQICETAFAFGQKTFVDLGLTSSRWGWQLGPLAPGDYTAPIYAGAGQNDITKGVEVGELKVSYDGSEAMVKYEMFPGNTLDETHLFVGMANVGTIAPGQFGNQHDLNAAASDSYSIGGFDGNDIFVVAHAVVCYLTE